MPRNCFGAKPSSAARLVVAVSCAPALHGTGGHPDKTTTETHSRCDTKRLQGTQEAHGRDPQATSRSASRGHDTQMRNTAMGQS